ncbi:c-type cytochrome [Chitinimonas koreensis]|uniref:c-type cytochrome n=1 Tax=Chitinimonas koreensis TaxID=356302 RepID=UPI00048E44ED|nr:cytochrome c [Chitinimonas koreensis]QNM97450.1 cytochrome c [Chitinimonas koreensis]
MQNKLRGLALATILALPASVMAAGNAQAGANKNSMCVGCHGIPGYHTAFPTVYQVPKIGGQHAEYIESALKGYKTGTRKHPTMTGIAAQLSDQDIADLAAYYAAKK